MRPRVVAASVEKPWMAPYRRGTAARRAAREEREAVPAPSAAGCAIIVQRSAEKVFTRPLAPRRFELETWRIFAIACRSSAIRALNSNRANSRLGSHLSSPSLGGFGSSGVYALTGAGGKNSRRCRNGASPRVVSRGRASFGPLGGLSSSKKEKGPEGPFSSAFRRTSYQRLLMYIVTSKPKRTSLNSGVVQAMVRLLFKCVLTAFAEGSLPLFTYLQAACQPFL